MRKLPSRGLHVNVSMRLLNVMNLFSASETLTVGVQVV